MSLTFFDIGFIHCTFYFHLLCFNILVYLNPYAMRLLSLLNNVLNCVYSGQFVFVCKNIKVLL